MKGHLLNFILSLMSTMALLSCTEKNTSEATVRDIVAWKEELRQLELAHMDSVLKYGFIKSLPLFWGSEFALIDRGEGPIQTLDSIRVVIEKAPADAQTPDYKLEWKPDFIDVSRDGTMGYTYGYYYVIPNDTTQKKTRGSYLTIWKKDWSGKWRLVID